ncbi:hypothetical protein [Phytoactinopolyspora halotolerans]|uniref:AAA family ATPase n=1 Tax=Phytoactinopolyspora halotolerans TaxID=1981512 RepID=A0A6L9SEF0_9ACTN|nr:hypothetical protein [Phytoactinopolyspora halotolerans]NEE03785.1 hypothetical protein [Phytoactinopolyspora halotolerans]
MNYSLVERARNLFEFLKQTQRLKVSTPNSTDTYQRDGAVLWLGALPSHQVISSGHKAEELKPDDPILTIDRVPRMAPPQIDPELERWLDSELDDPEHPPGLRRSVLDSTELRSSDTSGVPTGEQPVHEVHLADRPEIHSRYETWLASWRIWAEEELRVRPVRAAYNELFDAYITSTGSPEEFELVLGVGCLTWTPDDHSAVKRHLLTCPARIEFDDDSGRLSVLRGEARESMKVELDMLDPGLIRTHETVNEVRAAAREIDAHPLERGEVSILIRRLVHSLDPDGEYHDDDAPGRTGNTANASFAPAVILRKRSQRGMVEIFDSIIAQLNEAEDVPAGIVPLVDADYVPPTEPSTEPGAKVLVDNETFLPMPVNEKQLQIIERVDHRSQVLVQGPPGTGKTHTAAALI